jgi:hypothetical protein
LKAGVLEEGKWTASEMGTVQGGSISPLLANIYLHYAFDLWVHQWRKTRAEGDVIVVRYADDFIVGFQYRHEAEQFLANLRERFARFGLTLHPDKTRILEFGRFAEENRSRRGEKKAGDLQLPGVYPHLWEDHGRNVHRHPQDDAHEVAGEAERGIPGTEATHA